MVKWLRCLTRIQKILYLNLGIIIHGMTFVKSLAGELSQITHSYRASVSTLDGRDANTTVCKKEKVDRDWLHVDPNKTVAGSNRG